MLFSPLSTNHSVLNVLCLATGPKTPPNLHKTAFFLRNEKTSCRARSSVLSVFVSGALHLSHSNVCSSPWGAVSWWAHRLNGSLAAACVCVCAGAYCEVVDAFRQSFYLQHGTLCDRHLQHKRAHTQTRTGLSQVTTTGRAPVDFRSSWSIVTIIHNRGPLKAITLKYCGGTSVVDEWSVWARRNIVNAASSSGGSVGWSNLAMGGVIWPFQTTSNLRVYENGVRI